MPNYLLKPPFPLLPGWILRGDKGKAKNAKRQEIIKGYTYNPVTRLAEIPKCWSLEFQLDATFADNFCPAGIS